jgi:hypothetical protein
VNVAIRGFETIAGNVSVAIDSPGTVSVTETELQEATGNEFESGERTIHPYAKCWRIRRRRFVRHYLHTFRYDRDR